MTRFETVASLSAPVRATYEAISENGVSDTVGQIMGRTGYAETDTRQHLTTLCAKGLVACTGNWCHRTVLRARRV